MKDIILTCVAGIRVYTLTMVKSKQLLFFIVFVLQTDDLLSMSLINNRSIDRFLSLFSIQVT